MDISSKNRRIFLDLYSSPRGLLAYTLYSRYGLTPSEAVTFIEEYQKSGIIQVDADLKILLTKEGRTQIRHLTNSFESNADEEPSYLSPFIIDEGVGINEPYLPDESFYIKYYAREADKTSR